MDSAICFSAMATKQRIDAESGVIYGVSVITIGEAAGKNSGTWIDATTLSQLHSVASGFKDGVKVKLSQSKEHDGSAGQIVGVLKNFHTDGNQERADLHLLKSDAQFSKIIEMSSTMPSEFGLSISVPKNMEKVDGKNCLRISDIYSVDIVEQPAANKGGLFSKKDDDKDADDIKYSADGTTHEKSCECKMCMSKKNKTSMSKIIAMSLGLAETATEQEIADALKTALSANKPADLAALTAKLTEHETKLSTFEAANKEAVALAKKNEINALIAEASREGKVVPLTDVQLSKMEMADIKEMFSRLPKGQIRLSKAGGSTEKQTAPAFKTNEERIEFCRTQREAGATQLTASFAAAGLVQLN